MTEQQGGGGLQAILVLAGIIGLGGLGYFLYSRRKEKSAYIMAVSPITNGKFSIYPSTNTQQWVKDYIDKVVEGDESHKPYTAKLKYLRIDQVDNKDDSVRIRGVKNMNGKYKIYKRWYLDTDPTKKRMVAITLENDGKWDGEQPMGSVKAGKRKFWWFDEKLPKVILKAKK